MRQHLGSNIITSTYAFFVDWDKFQTTLADTQSYERALVVRQSCVERCETAQWPAVSRLSTPHLSSVGPLEPFEKQWPDDIDESDNVMFDETWKKVRECCDPPWSAAFESIFSFMFDCLELEKKEGFEPPPGAWVANKFSPDDVKAMLKQWKQIEYKPLLRRLPPKLRHRYVAMATYANEWKGIFKKARDSGQGIVICFNWDH